MLSSSSSSKEFLDEAIRFYLSGQSDMATACAIAQIIAIQELTEAVLRIR